MIPQWYKSNSRDVLAKYLALKIGGTTVMLCSTIHMHYRICDHVTQCGLANR